MANKTEYKYFSRELSWLSFNSRVLDESDESTLGVYDRLKFLAIHSSNLNEFIKTKIAALRALAERKDSEPEHVLLWDQVNAEINSQQKRFFRTLERKVLPQLRDQGFGLVEYANYTEGMKNFASYYFSSNVFSHTYPVIISDSMGGGFIQDSQIYLATRLYRLNKHGEVKKKNFYAYVNVPVDVCGRFISYTGEDGQTSILLLEDIIRQNIDELFPGYKAEGTHTFCLLRNADIEIKDEYEGNLIDKIESSIRERGTGIPSRFLYESSMSLNMLLEFKVFLNLSDQDMEVYYSYPQFSDFLDYPCEGNTPKERTVLRDSSSFKEDLSYFKQVEQKDHLLYFPYHSYDHVISFLNEASINPRVSEVYATLYRVAKNSSIVGALINASRNGKKVTVFVEAKARFDELRNIYNAEKMKQAGIQIIYSIPNVKVHAKLILVKMDKVKGESKRYAYIGTGNFNEKTASLYTDYGLFTSDAGIVKDVEELFSSIKKSKVEELNHKQLITSPFSSKGTMMKYIDQEIDHAKQGNSGHCIMKMNGLQDKDIIDKLYEASLAGVQVELIVRGILCLKPNQPYSKNIQVRRLVDKYLEHDRVYWFANHGDPIVLIGSADMMKRNLERRVEVLCPILAEEHKTTIFDILNILLKDDMKARIVDEELNNVRIKKRGSHRAQEEIKEYLNGKCESSPNMKK